MKPQAPEWLSLICQGEKMEEVDKWLDAAAEYGFKTVQPVFFWNGYTEADFDHLAAKLDTLDLSAVALGVYSDVYKWDQGVGACFKSTMEDFKLSTASANKINTRNLISWCGTTGDFAAPCEENSSEATCAKFKANQEKLLPTLKEHDVALLFEPWRDHILGDENLTADACAISLEHYQAVIDYPNFISPEQWPEREQRITTIHQVLAKHIGVIHLKDMQINDEGAVELPMFGKGELTQELTNALKPYVGKVPIVAEHFASPDDLPELLENIQSYSG